MELQGRKETKRTYVITKIRRISSMMDAQEYWNFVAGTTLVTLSVIGILCYLFV